MISFQINYFPHFMRLLDLIKSLPSRQLRHLEEAKKTSLKNALNQCIFTYRLQAYKWSSGDILTNFSFYFPQFNILYNAIIEY